MPPCPTSHPPTIFFVAHVEITNHVRSASLVLFTTVSLSWFPSVSEGQQGACWSGRDPEQPERPHGDPEHLPTAAEPEHTGEKPVWAWHCLEKLYLWHFLPFKSGLSMGKKNPPHLATNLVIWSQTSFTSTWIWTKLSSLSNNNNNKHLHY